MAIILEMLYICNNTEHFKLFIRSNEGIQIHLNIVHTKCIHRAYAVHIQYIKRIRSALKSVKVTPTVERIHTT